MHECAITCCWHSFSFIAAEKTKWMLTASYATILDMKRSVIDDITKYYNNERPNWFNGELTPNESERRHLLEYGECGQN